MTAVTDQLARLSPEQRALLLRRMASRKAETGIPRRPDDGPAPLSFAQRRLWFVQQLNPDSAAYNMMNVLRLRGPLNVTAMQRAFETLTDRHHALRSRYRIGTDGAPLQELAKAPSLPLIDLTTETDPETAAYARIADITARPHDLSGVPVRAGLIRLAAEDHVLAIGLHHIAADRWALQIMVRELAILYDACSRGQSDPLPPVPLQMADFALWQQGQSDEMQRQLDYWRERLCDAPALDLPRDHRPQPGKVAPGGFLPFALDAQLTAKARAMASRRGVSLYTLMLAAFAALMSRYGDTDDVVLGSDVSNRARPETQGMIGPLVNTLVLRTDLSGNPSFAEALARTETVLRDAFAHQDVPLDQVVEALNPERRADEMVPLFRAKLDLQQAETLPDAIHGLRIERFPYEERAAKYELRFNLEDFADRLAGRVEYRADLYEPDTIARMAAHFQRLLAAMLDAPETPFADLPMLTEAETRDLLALAQGPDLPSHAPTLHAAFEAQVDLTPHAPALWQNQQTLSYAELDAAANAVAAALIARELPPETRVGISMGRSPALVAAVLGVLKAGCAYVPLDPAYPQARLAFVAEDAGAGLVLTDGRMPPFAAAELIDVTALPPAPRPEPRGRAEGLAVIIYTSGSTGQPKGVVLEHRNILSRVAWARDAFSAEELAGVMFATSVSFDLSLFEIFATLANGGRIVLTQTLLDLPDLPPEAGVTMLNTVPSLLRELVKHHDLPASIRAVNLAGEFFPPALLDRLLEFPLLGKINNLYGPTEDSIYDAGNPVQDEPERPMPIGRPFPGTRLHILDRHGNLLPRGAAGEICLGGAGLARGYLNRPELTAQKFIADPFGPGRLYRSGDRARWRADGRIDILGRIDGQVKLRGQRIEIGEIEAVLEAHPDVAEAVVMATGEPGQTDRQLVAHLAPPPGRHVTAPALRTHLAALLPAHMVPQLWNITDVLPRMPNGKIDRRALSAMDVTGSTTGPVPPANETEARIIALWQDLLGQDGIGAEDDFFARGGHSLLAMKLVIRLKDAFGVDLPLGALFNALTPRLQAELVAGAAPAPDDSDDLTAGLSDEEVEALLAQMSNEEPVR
ncbi:amino acid adenylation domain-containing protein [Paracoccus caeni]|uniref:Amino acid adenylation domain-containing protein n=1 Tax=Paracoccus caeni TaxID=657651 RepID=A0A934SDQ0_9RHOB|nr:non-ribosomal peptide synthetase [Paracoccus caeni]MBK4215982.1 amino acid adenylation domain-containing protein [Paracoccus caeni]